MVLQKGYSRRTQWALQRFSSKTLTLGGKKPSYLMTGKSKDNSSVLPIRGWGKLTAIFLFFIKFLLTFKNCIVQVLIVQSYFPSQFKIYKHPKEPPESKANVCCFNQKRNSHRFSSTQWSFYFKKKTQQNTSAKKVGSKTLK